MSLIQILPFRSTSSVSFPKQNHIISLPTKLNLLSTALQTIKNLASLHLVSSITSPLIPKFVYSSYMDLLTFPPCLYKCCKCHQGHSLFSSLRLSSIIISFLKTPNVSMQSQPFPPVPSHSTLDRSLLQHHVFIKILSLLSRHEFLQGREFLFISVSQALSTEDISC